MSEDKIILYDLPSSEPCRAWSLNVWKIRLVLNYKKIPYETRWVPLSKVQETMISLGLDPNLSTPAQQQQQQQPYTVPTILLPSSSSPPKPIMNSLNIAPLLETLYPTTPSLHLQTSPHTEAQEATNTIIKSLAPYWLPRLSKTIMTPQDCKWSHEIRGPEAGYPLEEWEQLPPETIWSGAQEGFEKIEAMLGGNEEEEENDGPFLLGREVSYGDFVIVAAVKMLGRLGEEDLERCFKGRPRLRALWEACGEWMERED